MNFFMKIIETFAGSGLKPEILEAIKELGFEKPTDVQARTIPYLLENSEDLVALAQTGTGKTAAFGLPLVHKVDVNSRSIQALVLCPTRELCLQISRDIEKFTKFMPNFSSVSVYGGDSIVRQMRDLKKGANVVIGTPGRVIDLINRKKLDLSEIEYLVLDEADEMLNMGFKEELDEILFAVPDSRQTLLFSATMPKEIARIAKEYMHNPTEISVGNKNEATNQVQHAFYMVHARDRYTALRRLLDYNPEIYGIIFCRTRLETKEVADKLRNDHYSAEAIHGDLDQKQREVVMNKFRKKHLQILVATDVAARGIDVKDLTHVINYQLPDSVATYTHRSGRTGRAGKEGESLIIVNMKEQYKVRQIEKIIGKSIAHKQVPSGKEICERQLFGLIHNLRDTDVNEDGIGKFLPTIMGELEDLSREDLVKKFVSVEFNRFIEFYKDAENINVKPRGGDRRNDRRGSRGGNDENMVGIYVGVGKRDRVKVGDLMKLITKAPHLRGIEIGKVKLFDGFSVLDVDGEYANEVVKESQGLTFKGRRVLVKKDEKGGKKSGFRGQNSEFKKGNRQRGRKSDDKIDIGEGRGTKNWN